MMGGDPIDSCRESSNKYVHAIVARSGSSFYWAMRFLPLLQRQALFAVYAFCREIDDIADGAGSETDKISDLNVWREEIRLVYEEGSPKTRIGIALYNVRREFNIERKHLDAVIDGMVMDVRGPIVAPSFGQLDNYCELVAGAVGHLCMQIFGESEESAIRVINSLSRALQFTNILRDLYEDALMGRLYLPRELLADYDISDDTPLNVVSNPKVAAVCTKMAEMASHEFEEAKEALSQCNRRTKKSLHVMIAVYQGTLSRMKKTEWSGIAQPRHRSLVGNTWVRIRKLAIALRYGVFCE